MNFGLQNLDPQNLGAFSRNITFNQTSYDQYLKYHSGPPALHLDLQTDREQCPLSSGSELLAGHL
jgi:hypothetical protein